MTTPPITRVTGGVAGMAATYAAVRALADHYDAAGDRMRGWAATGGRTLADPDLAESAPLSPLTFAEAEEKVLAATTGVHGILVESVVYETDALLVRTTVEAFEECDRIVRGAFQTLDYLVGRAIGYDVAAAAPYAVALGVVATPAVWATWSSLPEWARDDVRRDGDVAAGLTQEWLDEHPAAEQHLIDGSGGLLDGLLAGTATLLPAAALGLSAFHPTTVDAAADLAGLYAPEGPPHVRRRRDLTVRLGGVPPRDLAGLMHHLAETDHLSPSDRPGGRGTIEVQTITAPDGTVRHVLYLPGTDDFNAPWDQDADVRDLETDLDSMAGRPDAYQQGILEALDRAGVGKDEPVLLVGHSLGGMEAAAILAGHGGYHVTDVVTAGSPTAQVPRLPQRLARALPRAAGRHRPRARRQPPTPTRSSRRR